MSVNVAMQGTGGSNQNAIGMAPRGQRPGAPNTGQALGGNLRDRELDMRQHYVNPGPDPPDGPPAIINGNRNVPTWMNNYDGIAVPYSAPSALKETMVERDAIRAAAGQAAARTGDGGVLRTDPISETEVAYLKAMKDQAELKKFDEYVESFIDPRKPGNMKWLMEVYPDYVNRRLQQAHTDYEYALRNQMIDLSLIHI